MLKSKCDLSDFNCGMADGACLAGLNISETFNLLGFSHNSLLKNEPEQNKILYAVKLQSGTP